MTIVAPAVGAPISSWYDEITAAVNGAAFEPVNETSDGYGETSSSSYTSTLSGTTPLTATFVAARGWHIVTISGRLLQYVAGPANQYMSFDVAGSGFSWGPNDDDAIECQWDFDQRTVTSSRRTKITGLTVGNSYTVTLQYKAVSGNNIGVAHRSIMIE